MSRAWLLPVVVLLGFVQTPPEEVSAGLDEDLWAGVQFGAAGEVDAAAHTARGPVYPHLYAVTVDHVFSRSCSVRGLVLGRREYWRVEEAGTEPRLVASQAECVPAPPAPPRGGAATPAVITDAVRRRLPPPRLSIAPRPGHGGLTGLASHLWYDPTGLGPVDHDGEPGTPERPGLEITVAAGPWDASASAAIVVFRWHIGAVGGPMSTYTSRRPGSPGRPAARHTPARAGPHRITVVTEWSGVVRWIHTDTGERGTAPLGPVRLSTTRSYRVDQVRAVPLPDPSVD